jgi:hypothetical protein
MIVELPDLYDNCDVSYAHNIGGIYQIAASFSSIFYPFAIFNLADKPRSISNASVISDPVDWLVTQNHWTRITPESWLNSNHDYCL